MQSEDELTKTVTSLKSIKHDYCQKLERAKGEVSIERKKMIECFNKLK